jgi:hypothetical protein
MDTPEQIAAQLATELATPDTVVSDLPVISQKELRKFVALDKKVSKLTKERDEIEASLKNLRTAGARVEKGTLTAELKYSERRTPSWKQEAIGLADTLYGKGEGEPWAKTVIEKTEPTPSVKLVVE